MLVRFDPDAAPELRDGVIRAIGATVDEEFPQLGLTLLALPDGLDPLVAQRRVASLPEVEAAEPNTYYYATVLPDDPDFALSWPLHEATTPSPGDADIDAPEAWEEATGSPQVVLAVIDSGIDYTHGDLVDNVWSNPREIAGNQLDDDNNGYVDDVHGIDTANNDTDPMDDMGHGTHVAGIIAARGNNGVGSAGVMWDARLVACKFMGADGVGRLSSALSCLNYVAGLHDAGVAVIATNNSWGGLQTSQLLDDAINAQQQRGIVFVAAAGNDRLDTDQTPSYPSAYTDDIIISVAATDRLGHLASFSNHGRTSVDIGAPGDEVYSTLPGNRWGYLRGTSMAAPHVTGLVGLLAAVDPSLSASAIKSRILTTGTAEATLASVTVSGARVHMDIPVIDSDGDGMPNRWEVTYGLNPNNASDAASDPDGDGLTNLEEFSLHTNPVAADTDGDGLNDGVEVRTHHTNPQVVDSDGDGLNDGAEVTQYGSSPTSPDTDGDGLGDAGEVAGGTNPARSDTDGDGLVDGWELDFGFDPRHTNDASGDADGDGLSNIEEYTLQTNPRAIDSDSDGLTDFDEVRTRLTGPTNPDTDNDGMLDGWEVRFGFNPRSAADALTDADSDSYSNRTEARAGSDPRDASSIPPVLPWTTVQGNASHTGELRIPTAGADFSVRWQVPIPLTNRDQHLTVDAGLVLVNDFRTSGAAITALALLDGRSVWDSQLVEGRVLGSVAVLGSTAYQIVMPGYETRLRALDKVTGAPRFSVPLTDAVESWPRAVVPHNDRIFAHEGTNLVAFDASNGNRRWSRNVVPANGVISDAPPAVDNNYVVAFEWNTLTVLNRATGAIVFQRTSSCDASPHAKVALDDAGDAYVVHGGCLTKFDISSRTLVWEVTGIDEVAPAIVGNSVYVGSGPTLRVLDSANGTEQWQASLPSGATGNILVTRDHAFVSTFGGTVAIDRTSHLATWSYPAFGMLAATDEEALLIWSSDGLTAINIGFDDDHDGLPNWWERYNGFDYHRAADATADADGDGLDNLAEYNGRTLPRNRDTDSDGLSDGIEVSTYRTDPRAFDSDSDGLGDGREVNQLTTNPLRGDTDGDGVADGDEVNSYQTNPLDAQSHPNLVNDYRESFEQGTAVGWTPGYSSGPWVIVGNDASNGRLSLQVDGALPMVGQADITFSAAFAGGDLTFDARRGAGDANEPTASLVGPSPTTVIVDDSTWQRYAIHIPQGQRSVRFQYQKLGSATDTRERGFWIDNVAFRKPRPFASREDRLLLAVRNTLVEYDLVGRRTRAALRIPNAPDEIDGLALTSAHKVALSDPPRLHLYDPLNDTFSTTVVPGWQGIQGGIASVGDFLFAVNLGGVPGLLRFRVDGSFRDVGLLGSRYFALAGGRDGFLYASNAETSRVEKIDPATMHVVSSRLCNECSAIAVNQQGHLYAAVFGEIRRMNASGQVLSAVQTGAYAGTLDIAPDGSLRFGTTNGFGIAQADLNGIRIFSVGETPRGMVGVTRAGRDTDADGMPDWWESHHGLSVSGNDAVADHDGDGLTNLQEFTRATEPDAVDTDRDGVADFDELTVRHSDPLLEDTDGDGIWDGAEVAQGSDVNRTDTDGDGLTDGSEAFHGTNPRVADTDTDGLPDGWEITHALDPLSGEDAATDSDGDGLTTTEEFGAGTDVALSDSDGDGLSDGDEVHHRATNPAEADTDGDDASDGWEVANSFDPRSADSDGDADGDRFANRLEFFAGTNPRDATSVPIPLPWTTFQGDAKHRGYVAVALDPADLREAWRRDVLAANDRPLEQSVSGNGRVFVTPQVYGSGQVVSAFNARTGQTLWTRNFGNVLRLSPPALANGRVYVQTSHSAGSMLWGLNVQSGAVVMQTPFVSQSQALPTPTPFAGDLFGFDGYGGSTARFDGAGAGKRWSTDPFADLSGSVAAVDDVSVYVYYADDAGQLVALDRATGNVRYRFADPQFAQGSLPTAPVLGAHHDVILAQGGRLMAFDAVRRTLVWHRTSKFSGQPAFANGDIFAVDDGDLVVVNARDGMTKWRWNSPDPITGSIIVTLTHAIVSSDAATYVIDLASHQSVWSLPMGGNLSLGNDGMLYVAGNTGVLVAIQTFTDDDADGMADSWERRFGLDAGNAADAALDGDADGLINIDEYFTGTDPVRRDSDADGLSDGDEVARYRTYPVIADSDLDGLADGEEIGNTRSDPLNPDSDGDGLKDGREVHELATDPTKSDSDGDGFNDGWEVDQSTNPRDGNSVPVAVRQLTESFESGSLPPRWANGMNANAGWEVVAQSGFDGRYRVRSLPIGHSEIAAVEWTEYFVESEVSFAAYVSSESCCDLLRLFVDGSLVKAISDKQWQTHRVALSAGIHTLRWEYAKNDSVVSGSDRAFIDFVRVGVLDTDHDAIPDAWERDNGLNPNSAFDADLDADNDGLVNRREYELETLPKDADTDDDGMRDGWEVTYALDPKTNDAGLDADGDGATNGREFDAGSDPRNASSRPATAPPPSGGGGGGGSVDSVMLLLLLALAALISWRRRPR